MHIALLTNGLFPWVVGGMQKHSSNLIREWLLLGVDLDVYFTQAPGYPGVAEMTRAILPDGASGRVRFFACPPSWLPYFPLHHYADCYVESARIAEQVIRESSNVDFIYAQALTGWKLLRMRRRGMRLPPIGVNLHGMEALQHFRGGVKERLVRWVAGPIERWILRHADVAFSLGGRLDDIIRAAAPQAVLLRSGNGIASDWLCDWAEPHDGPRRFVFVGRSTRRKGLHVLHQAIRATPAEPKCEIHVVGDIAKSERLNDVRVSYYGSISDETKLRSLLRQMDVLICPSLAEGVPTVVLEAMASGLAVIATDVGATAELVDESNGWLISAGDALKLTQVLVKAIAQGNGDLSRLKHRSREKARRYCWPSIASETSQGIRRQLGLLERALVS